MDDLMALRLALWREASRHADFDEIAAGFAHAIGSCVPLKFMRVLAGGKEGWRLLVSSPPAAGLGRWRADGREGRALTSAAGVGGVVVAASRPEAWRALEGLAGGASGDRVLLAGVRGGEGGMEGLVVWGLAEGAAAGDRAVRLLEESLEPLGVAIEASRRFHELEGLRRSAEAETESALRRLGRESLSEALIGEGTGLRAAMERVGLVAGSDLPVLILGETGSGKEVVARAIHERSPRHSRPFIRVNCGAIPAELIDSHLFGHERGAFTGAGERHAGWFERAHEGTLFLDEIGELPPAAQVRLLRVLQDGSLERVGGRESVTVDCRVVAATHRDLAGMVRDGTFREDLWYRLAVFPIMIPPLRDRREDLAELLRHFAHRAAVRFGLPEFETGEDDVEYLAGYPWPGNIREFAAVIDRAALLAQGPRLALREAMAVGPDRPTRAPAGARTGTAPLAPLSVAIREHIEAALAACHGKVEGPEGAAALLEVNPSTLRSKMRKLGIGGKSRRLGLRGATHPP